MTLLYILFILAFYFFGAIPFMLLIGRIRGADLSQEPDLHHALWHKVGRRWSLLGVLLDILKGALPVMLGFLWALPLAVTALAALASLCGQMWPVSRKFDGERGNTVSLGIIGTFSIINGAPLIVIIGVSFAVTGLLIRTFFRWKSSGSTLNERLRFGGSQSMVFPLCVIMGFISTPFTSCLFGQPMEITLCCIAATVLMLIRRVTGGLLNDLHASKHPLKVIINRLLFDRSEI